MRDPFITVISIIVILAWCGLIWAMAHGTVAKECEKLGSFYVGDKVYECKLKTTDNGRPL